ncbi:MAG: hypothetical protein M8352_07840 [ANME-2 cluster archaeon]|nr:hypothetical protein [ANME-2 cluster archaeon]MDF1531795.1 hypothetical protein [ANME-2 cluster archaeon]
MKQVVLLLFLLFVLIQTATAQSVITIDILENGNAVWTMEEYLPLANQNEIDEWKGFIQSREITEQYQFDIEEFSKRIEGFIYLAEVSSDRSMNVENYNVSYGMVNTISGAFGIVRFSFEWTNFSIMDSNKIVIGDVFSEGMILSTDNVLTIKVPDGYKVASASPDYDRRDGNGLIWDGTISRSFKAGEPALILERKSAGLEIISVLLVALIVGSFVVLWNRRDTLVFDIKRYMISQFNSPQPEILADDEMIENILVKAGGQEYQSEIVSKSGLSKSTISILIKKMNEEGKVIKIKKGKGNIIRLVKE